RDRRVAKAVGQQRVRFEAAAPAAVVGGVVNPDVAAGDGGLQRDVLEDAAEDLETRPARQVEQGDVRGRYLELAVGIGAELGSERLRVLVTEVVPMPDYG